MRTAALEITIIIITWRKNHRQSPAACQETEMRKAKKQSLQLLREFSHGSEAKNLAFLLKEFFFSRKIHTVGVTQRLVTGLGLKTYGMPLLTTYNYIIIIIASVRTY